MSLALFPIDVAKVLLPVAKINERKDYGVLKGSAETSWKAITTQSYSTSSIQFTAPPPSPSIIVSRKVYLNVTFTINFTGVAADNLTGILRGPVFGTGDPRDAPRAYPLSSVISTLTAKLNNTDVSINLSDVIQPLLRYHNDIDPLHNYDYSLTPSMMDQYQVYGQGEGTALAASASNRNPLAAYGTNAYEFARGGFAGLFPVTNPAGGTTAQVTLNVTEPLFLPPMLFGTHQQECGFIGLQTFDLNVTLGNLARLWSHDAQSPATNVVVSSVQILSPPQLLFQYFTPQEIENIPRAIVYPYFEVNRYPTDLAPFAFGASASVNSANIQLNSIPRRMYILARQNNTTQTANSSDSFFVINSISINWNNRAGLLSGATQMDLYNISVKNGCNLSWTQWSDQVGSVLCVDFGDDIGLNDLEAPGMLGTYQLQITVNISNVAFTSPITPSLYVITVAEGTFTLTENRSVAQIGVLSKKDVLESRSRPLLDYNYAQKIYGGNFFGSIRSLFEKAASNPLIQSIGKKVGEKVLDAAAKKVGLGKKRSALRGGNLVSRDQLRNRMEEQGDDDEVVERVQPRRNKKYSYDYDSDE